MTDPREHGSPRHARLSDGRGKPRTPGRRRPSATLAAAIPVLLTGALVLALSSCHAVARKAFALRIVKRLRLPRATCSSPRREACGVFELRSDGVER